MAKLCKECFRPTAAWDSEGRCVRCSPAPYVTPLYSDNVVGQPTVLPPFQEETYKGSAERRQNTQDLLDRARKEKRDPGIKYDQGKTRMDLLPVDALEGVAEVLTFGANKYGDRNWENGMHHGRLWGALLRHMGAHIKGEFYDKETGLAHVKHAACCMLMLLSHVLRGIGTDDLTKNQEEG